MQILTLPMETKRLLLRPFRIEDAADSLKNWAGDPLVQPFYAEPVYKTLEEAEEMIRRYLKQCEVEHSACRWAICQKEDARCIGQISYYHIDAKNNWAELEYCIGRAFQGNGYMTEAVFAAISYGFETMQLHRVQISHNSNNSASRRVIQKSGFQYEGTLREALQTETGYADRLYYSLLASEWKK